MSSHLLLSCAVGLALGVAFRSLFIIDSVTLVTVLTLVFLLTLLCHGSERASRSFVCGVAGVLLCIGIGVWRFSAVEAHYTGIVEALAPLEERIVSLTGTVSRDVEPKDGGRVLYVLSEIIDEKRIEALVRVTTDSGPPIRYGDRVTVTGKISRPKTFETDLGRTFRYEEYLRAGGVTHALSYAEVAVQSRASGDTIQRTFFGALYSLKQKSREGIEQVLPEPHAGFGEGLLLGEKHALGKKLEETFRTVGIIHIIVLSGYNLSIVAESLMRLLSRFFYPRTRMLIGVAAIALFAIMVGLSATVVRAAIMATLVLLARGYGRSYVIVNGLALAGAVMVLANPYVLLYDPGFQLSFLATLGLIYVAPLVERLLVQVPSRFQMREYLTATISTQLFVTPFLLYSMGSFSLVSVLANVLVLAVVPVTMLFVLVAGIGGMVFGDAAIVIGYPAYLLLSYILGVAENLALIPYALVTVETFPLSAMVSLYVVLIVALFVWWRFGKTAKESEEAVGR